MKPVQYKRFRAKWHLQVGKLALWLAILLPVQSLAENLLPQDLNGSWKSYRSTTKGEINRLVIDLKNGGVFERQFSRAKNQKAAFDASDIQLVENLLIIKTKTNKYSRSYKLVLEGWKLNRQKMLFGTLFMYSEGTLFNGLPISFTAD